MARQKMSARLAASNDGRGVIQIDNHPRTAGDKAEIRRLVLEAVAAPVFDAFAGEGHMHRRVWHAAPGYVGCDLRWFPEDPRPAFVADNRRVLRCIDLGRFGIFDLDAYGSPWEAALIIAGRRTVRPGERIGFALTEGSYTKLKMGDSPRALATLCGMRAHTVGLAQAFDDVVAAALRGLAERMRCEIKRVWRARGKSAARVLYLGLVLEGRPAT
jgi:hypothetical protein